MWTTFSISPCHQIYDEILWPIMTNEQKDTCIRKTTESKDAIKIFLSKMGKKQQEKLSKPKMHQRSGIEFARASYNLCTPAIFFQRPFGARYSANLHGLAEIIRGSAIRGVMSGFQAKYIYGEAGQTHRAPFVYRYLYHGGWFTFTITHLDPGPPPRAIAY